MSVPVPGFEDKPPHMRPELSNRGFKHMPALDVAYGGRLSAYESSAAEEPHLWLNAVAVNHPGMPGSDKTTATIHLSLDDAVRLIQQLDWLIANHYHHQ